MGLFEQNVDPDEGVELTPSPVLAPLGPAALGIPQAAMQGATPPFVAPQRAPLQMPTPPQAPGEPGAMQKILSMALLGLAAGLGPRKGNGIPQGLMQGQHINDAQRQQEFHNQQGQYEQQQQEALRMEALQQQADRTAAIEQQKRQAALQQALMTIKNEVKTLPDKAAYDQRIEGYAGLLQGSGYRLDANWLRQAVPYVAPSGKKVAEDALQAFFKNPLTQQQMKTDPNAIANGSIKIDLNGDGVPELVPVLKVMEAAGMSVLADGDGKPVGLTAGTQGDLKHVALDNLIKQFKAENRRDPDPKEMVKLVADAEGVGRAPKEPKDPEMVDLTKQLARQRLADAQNKAASLPAPAQRRVDSKSKGFEALPVVKSTQKMAEAVSFANGLDVNTKNPADDQALIYAFAKAMDPDSVVREGEYATVQKYAQSWAQSFGFNTARMFTNTAFLTPQARQNMKTTINSKFSAARGQYENARKSYAKQINQITGQQDGDSYLTDFGGAFPEDAKPSDGKPPVVDAAASARAKLKNR